MVHNHSTPRPEVSELFLVTYPNGRLVVHSGEGANREERINSIADSLMEYDFERGKAFHVYLIPDTPLRKTPRLLCTIGLNAPYVVVWSNSELRNAR